MEANRNNTTGHVSRSDDQQKRLHSPVDFWLFDYLKDRLDSYPEKPSSSEVVAKELHSIPIMEYRKTLWKWIERIKLCIKHHGDYFEHLQEKDLQHVFSTIRLISVLRAF